MPVSAICTDMVDYILNAESIEEKLLPYLKYILDTTGKVPIPEEYSNNTILKIFSLIRSKTGHDFSYYKTSTIIRRIERRVKLFQIHKIEQYVDILQEDKKELNALFQDFLIGVTNFFRDVDVFEKYYQFIIPELFAQAIDDKNIRIWIPACSTGEEAYTIAILLKEYMNVHQLHAYNVQIFATDLDRNAIHKARQAIYPSNIAEDIPDLYLHKYFTLEKKSYLVNKSLRDMIVFAEQSVIKDPPFSKMDFISCRNLLIYMTNELQEKVISTFHYALKPNGYLLLGSSETLGKNKDLFTIIDKKWKFYQKNKIATDTVYVREIPSYSLSGRHEGIIKQGFSSKNKLSLGDLMERKIIEHFTPAAVMVNKSHEILFLKGNTSPYLEPVQGIASMNLIEMAKSDIRITLKLALNKAINENKSVIEEKVGIKQGKSYKYINIHIHCIDKPSQENNLYMVVFEDITEKEIFSNEEDNNFEKKDSNYIQTLEAELKQTKDYLQSVIETAETTNEELKATNEEMQSSNEELQSTNEELETSKEELQSINEELITVNTEYQNKINELSDINNDISNILTNTDIAIIFLDLDLRIKKFTPKITDFIDLIAADINRPIQNFVTRLNYPDFQKDVKSVVETLNTVEKEIEGLEKNYICRMKPYRTQDNVVTGVVLTFIDVTKLKSVESDLRNSLKKLNFHTENTPLAVIEFNEKFQISKWSTKAKHIFGWDSEEVLGKAYNEIPWVYEGDAKRIEQVNKTLLNHQNDKVHVINRNYRKDGTVITCEWYSSAHFNEENQLISVYAFVLDVTKREESIVMLKQSEEKYHQLFESSPEVIIIHDLEMNILDINKQAIHEFGYKKHELMQKKVFELHPENEKPHAEEVLDEMIKVKSLIIRGQFLRKDGSIFTAIAKPNKCFYAGKEVIQVLISKESEV